MKKIIIIGNSGSGKTWLGEKMAAVLGIAHISLDSIFWQLGGYNRKRNDVEIETDLKRIQDSESWLAEGVFGHLADQLVPFADALIYIDMPWEECRSNLLNRGSESSRQLDPVKAEENFQALLKWASAYETRDSKASKKYHDLLFGCFSGERYVVRSRDEAHLLLEKGSANPPLNRTAHPRGCEEKPFLIGPS